jgi:hypothetical protein
VILWKYDGRGTKSLKVLTHRQHNIKIKQKQNKIKSKRENNSKV